MVIFITKVNGFSKNTQQNHQVRKTAAEFRSRYASSQWELSTENVTFQPVELLE
ncbi:hypothetical protein I79_022782 [Cricetulus griseus]|uniref:Uncharacterized protein n=1 Tax=Cricetulus griseus TaxID=10029 RepID=G3IGA0_CRIGR|nr:hypothetical protein I79_022782 [Cricetulus griseus]